MQNDKLTWKQIAFFLFEKNKDAKNQKSFVYPVFYVHFLYARRFYPFFATFLSLFGGFIFQFEKYFLMFITRFLMPKDTMKNISANDELASRLIVTTDESGQQNLIESIPTIYPNDYDYDIENLKAKSAGSRSFILPTAKALGQEHRNKSVPHNLQVQN